MANFSRNPALRAIRGFKLSHHRCYRSSAQGLFFGAKSPESRFTWLQSVGMKWRVFIAVFKLKFWVYYIRIVIVYTR